MADQDAQEVWDLWYPQAAAAGMSFARGRIAVGAQQMLVHAAPPVLTVKVYVAGQVVAAGSDLAATADSPMTLLTRRGDHIEREDLWPGPAELGQLVILCGGEVGTLVEWWHAEDRKEWRWRVEFYNSRR